MQKIANMIWRIGELLEFDQQLAWMLESGFDGVSFHASAGVPGEWQGIEPSACSAQDRARLHQKIAQFSFSEIHAPFAIELKADNLSSSLAALGPVLDLAGDLNVTVVTVHAQLGNCRGDAESSVWIEAMEKLNAAAVKARTLVGLEIVAGFEMVKNWNLSNVGVTLDVGHMYAFAQHSLVSLGGIGGVVRLIRDALVHLHVHDFDGKHDHMEVGKGSIDFREMAMALKGIEYQGGMCLELNPRRVSAEGIIRSKQYLTACLDAVGL